MACFIVSAAEAAVVTAVEKRVEKKEQMENASGTIPAEEEKISLSRKLKWLTYMLWGGVAFDHGSERIGQGCFKKEPLMEKVFQGKIFIRGKKSFVQYQREPVIARRGNGRFSLVCLPWPGSNGRKSLARRQR